MKHISRTLGDRVVLVLFGLSVLAMLAAAVWAPVYIAGADDKRPPLVALFMGLFLGCNGGVVIAAILAASARQDVCDRAERQGYLRGLERGRSIGREDAFLMAVEAPAEKWAESHSTAPSQVAP